MTCKQYEFKTLAELPAVAALVAEAESGHRFVRGTRLHLVVRDVLLLATVALQQARFRAARERLRKHKAILRFCSHKEKAKELQKRTYHAGIVHSLNLVLPTKQFQFRRSHLLAGHSGEPLRVKITAQHSLTQLRVLRVLQVLHAADDASSVTLRHAGVAVAEHSFFNATCASRSLCDSGLVGRRPFAGEQGFLNQLTALDSTRVNRLVQTHARLRRGLRYDVGLRSFHVRLANLAVLAVLTTLSSCILLTISTLVELRVRSFAVRRYKTVARLSNMEALQTASDEDYLLDVSLRSSVSEYPRFTFLPEDAGVLSLSPGVLGTSFRHSFISSFA